MNNYASNEQQFKEQQVRANIRERLVNSGEKQRLKDRLQESLSNCGWREHVKEYCKEVINCKGLEKITVDDLVQEVTPKGKALVPDTVKADMLQQIKKFLAKQDILH